MLPWTAEFEPACVYCPVIPVHGLLFSPKKRSQAHPVDASKRYIPLTFVEKINKRARLLIEPSTYEESSKMRNLDDSAQILPLA